MSTRWRAVWVGCVCLWAIGCAATPKRQVEAARLSYDMGVASLTRGDLRDALRALLRAKDQDPLLPEAHHALGLVYHALDKRDLAKVHYQEALRLRPGFSEAHNNYGTLLIDRGELDEAISAFRVAIGDILYATPSHAEGNMGWAYYLKGDVAQATLHIGNAVATDPEFCRGYQWLARIALEQDRPDEIIAQGERFRRHCLDNAHVARTYPARYQDEMQYYLAMGHLKKGRVQLARTLLIRCAGDEPDRGGYAQKCKLSLDSLMAAP